MYIYLLNDNLIIFILEYIIKNYISLNNDKNEYNKII